MQDHKTDEIAKAFAAESASAARNDLYARKMAKGGETALAPLLAALVRATSQSVLLRTENPPGTDDRQTPFWYPQGNPQDIARGNAREWEGVACSNWTCMLPNGRCMLAWRTSDVTSRTVAWRAR